MRCVYRNLEAQQENARFHSHLVVINLYELAQSSVICKVTQAMEDANAPKFLLWLEHSSCPQAQPVPQKGLWGDRGLGRLSLHISSSNFLAPHGLGPEQPGSGRSPPSKWLVGIRLCKYAPSH